jgi:hypothetical protein
MKRREGAAVVGVGAAACAVCCAGPILAFLGAIGLSTVVGVAAFGVIGLLIALLAVPLLLRRRPRSHEGSTGLVQVEAPTVRTRS